MRKAEQRWPAESKADDKTSTTTCSASAEESTTIALSRIPTSASTVTALESGRVDAFASDKLLLYGAEFKNPQAVHALSDDLSIEPYAIALPRGDWELRLAVNTALAELYRSGDIKKIFGVWFGQLGLRPGALLEAVYQLGAVAK